MSTFSEPMFETSSILANMRDLDISNLATEKNALEAELAQCKADKDFVWSLWKRLQVSNPDVTEAISLVIQREKDKSETKDRKVLEIIQVKDDRIEELQSIITRQSEEVSDILTKKAELTEKSSLLRLDKDKLQDKLRSLEAQLRSEESRERSLEDTFRKTVEGSEKEKYDLSRHVSKLMTELEVAKSEKIHAQNRQKLLEERTKCLETEVSHKMVKFEDLVREVEDSTGRLSRYESQTTQQRRDLDFKNQELENVRKELKELWLAHNQLTEHSGQQADLIRQLQNLQQDTQKMMKNQEDAFTMESTSLQQMFTDVNTRYETSKRTEAELRQQVLELKKSLMDKDDEISSLQTQADFQPSHYGAVEHKRKKSVPDYSNSFLDIVKEVDSMDEFQPNTSKPRGRSLSRLSDGHDFDRVDPIRSRSLSPTPSMRSRMEETSAGDQHVQDQKVEELEKALNFKKRQVKELRQAHDNRLQRLQSLQASYKIARDELKAMDGVGKSRGRKPKRANPRSLQKENSDQVWNELSFFKAENRTLQVDKLGLQEEIDFLRVQTSHDAATIYELKVSSQSLRDEYEFQLRKIKRDTKETRDNENQLSAFRSQVHNKTIHIEKLERDITNAVSQRDDLVQEKSKLMSQLVSAQQEASQHRMELADMKHELQSLRFELEEQKFQTGEVQREANQVKDSHVVNAVASRLLAKQKKMKKNKNDSPTKKYQKALNTSIERMSDTFENFNDDGWEEVSDCESESESELSSLGDSIAKLTQRSRDEKLSNNKDTSLGRKRVQRVPTHRPPPGHPGIKSPKSDSSTSPHRASFRDNTTSPISFLSPTFLQSEQMQPPPAHQPPSISKPLGPNAVRRRAMENRQVTGYKSRIHSLQQQVALLKRSKFVAVKSEEELRETVAKLHSELSGTSSRLKSAKQQVAKFQGDVEKLQKDRENTGNMLDRDEEKRTGEGQEVKVLEAKLKVANSEASRHSAAMRNLKTENDGLHEQVRNLQDRINHLERDVTQKRSLLENQRMKLKLVQDVSKTEANNLEELQTKLKILTDNNNKLKVQIDSLKKRIGVVSKDKKNYEEKFLKVSLELEHKSKLLQEATARRSSLEMALSELEASAQHQLHGLASQSEAAIDAAKVKLTQSQKKISHFQSLVKILATELVKRTERARAKMMEAKASQERSQREEDLSLQRAQDKARDILNLSHSDLEDIMSADGESISGDSVTGDNKKADRRWLRKCEKLTNSEDFVHPLTILLLQKADERADLLMKIPKLN